MIPCGGKWLKTPREEPPPKKKRRVTPRMIRANKSNAKKSCGARTLRGKAKSAMNATTHALTCRQLVFIDGESIAEFENELAVWVRELGATTAAEIAQVRTALYADWQALRADRATACAVQKNRDTINDQWENAKAQEVWSLIPKLTKKPKEVYQQLIESTFGCSWLIDQLGLILVWLETHPSLEVSMRGFTLALGGHDRLDLFTDPVVMEFNRAYFGGIAPHTTAAEAANALQYDRPKGMTYTELERCLVRHMIDTPGAEQSRSHLINYIETAIDRLRKWSGLIALREQRDVATEIGLAQADVSPEGSRRQGYAAASRRIHFSALRMLLALKQERRKSADADPGPRRPLVAVSRAGSG